MNDNAKTKNVLVSKVLFYFAYTILLMKIICGRAKFIDNISQYITLFELVLLSVCILVQTRIYKIKTLVLIIVVLLVCLYSYTITNNSNIIIVFFFIFAMKNIEFEKFIRYDIKAKIIFLLFNLVLIYIGVLENIIFYRQDGGIRQTFGFASPNSFGGIIMSICFEWLYLKRNKINGLKLSLLVLVSIILAIICDSRTAELCLILLVIFMLLFNKKIYLKKVIPYIPIILTGISLVLVYLYDGQYSFIMKLDDILSTRITCAYNFFNLYDLNLFGNFFEETDVWLGYMNTLDNAYLYLLLNQGILLYIFVIFINMKILKIAVKENNTVLVVILITFCLYGLMERGTFFITYNVFLLCAKDLLFKNKELEEKQYERIDKCNSTSI